MHCWNTCSIGAGCHKSAINCIAARQELAGRWINRYPPIKLSLHRGRTEREGVEWGERGGWNKVEMGKEGRPGQG